MWKAGDKREITGLWIDSDDFPNGLDVGQERKDGPAEEPKAWKDGAAETETASGLGGQELGLLTEVGDVCGSPRKDAG